MTKTKFYWCNCYEMLQISVTAMTYYNLLWDAINFCICYDLLWLKPGFADDRVFCTWADKDIFWSTVTVWWWQSMIGVWIKFWTDSFQCIDLWLLQGHLTQVTCHHHDFRLQKISWVCAGPIEVTWWLTKLWSRMDAGPIVVTWSHDSVRLIGIDGCLWHLVCLFRIYGRLYEELGLWAFRWWAKRVPLLECL